MGSQLITGNSVLMVIDPSVLMGINFFSLSDYAVFRSTVTAAFSYLTHVSAAFDSSKCGKCLFVLSQLLQSCPNQLE